MTRRSFSGAAAAAVAMSGPLAAEVRPDSGGMLVIHGRRRFVVGLYQLPKIADPWPEVRDAGFNLVHVGASREELDLAARHQLYGWVTVGSIAPPSRSADESRIRNIVESCKDHPALLFWETEDEPSYQWKKPGARIPPENIIAARRLLKSIDPVHPAYLNHPPANLVATLGRYNGGADIVATDIYPVIPHGIRELYALWPDGLHGDLLNPYISQIGRYADKMRQVAGPSRAVFLVLQAFAWENLREKDRDPAMVLYPDRHQLRFMAYQAIAHGVNGLLFWGLDFTPPDAPLWPVLKGLAAELRGLQDELAARPLPLPLGIEYYDTGHSLDRGIEWIAKPSRGGVLLIAVNADLHVVEAAFSGLAAFQHCEVLAGGGGAKLHRGTLRDQFQPFGVRLYRLTR